MYESEMIWELFLQVVLEMWQGGQGELSFSIEHKPLIEMSLAQGCEDQLRPINQTVQPSRFQRGISIAEVFAVSWAFTSGSGTGSANNQPLWHCKAWNTSRDCLGWWRKDPLTVILPAASGTGWKLFLHISQWFYVYLGQMCCPGALPLSSLCSEDLVCLQSMVCVCCTQTPAMDEEI